MGTKAKIQVQVDAVVGRISPDLVGACIEDVNHEIYGGLYSQLLFGESFEYDGGGAANSTLFNVLYLYRNGWQYFKMSYASALAWVLCFIILLLTLVVFRISGRLVYFEGQLKD